EERNTPSHKIVGCKVIQKVAYSEKKFYSPPADAPACDSRRSVAPPPRPLAALITSANRTDHNKGSNLDPNDRYGLKERHPEKKNAIPFKPFLDVLIVPSKC
ncbi:MAG: hypothetical protein IJM88_02135, partial [Bacteroidales bacterium]|nr:hypothetical protein [Bacteroidales bacterium]